MDLNNRQKRQLEFWIKFKGVEEPTLMQYFSAQPRQLWVLLVTLIIISSTSFYYFGYDGFRAGTLSIGLPVPFIMYLKFRRGWALVRHCLNWDKIEELIDDLPNHH
jgi:hypothetical protein